MTEGAKPVRFFLGANSPSGFVCKFDQLERQPDGWNTYIIKGGPGSGKSTLMKNIAKALREDGEAERIEEIYCASDCASLDGVILHGRHASLADGTAPHTLEPRYPGAYDSTVNLGACWDEDALRQHQEEIMQLGKQVASLHAQSSRFLAAFGALTQDNTRIALEHTNLRKTMDYARRLASREFKETHNMQPHEDVRFISAICDRGVVWFEETARSLAQKIYIFEDLWGAASRALLSELRTRALACGLDIIACYCPSDPEGKLEHLFIPALSLGFMTSNRMHPLTLEPFRVIHARRFTDMEALHAKKQRMAFNRRAAAEMLEEAVGCLAAAKELHDALERYYIGAMDFTKLAQMQSDVLKRLKRSV